MDPSERVMNDSHTYLELPPMITREHIPFSRRKRIQRESFVKKKEKERNGMEIN